jgi:hydroxyacylglutathione hydrolase
VKRLKKILKWTGIVLGTLLVLMTIFGRVLRHRATTVREIRPGVKHVTNLFTEMYGARAGNRVMLFDAGVDERGDALDALLAGLGATRDQVTDVFLSHGHFDHVAAAALCKNARIHVGVQDTDLLSHKMRIEPGPARWLSKLYSVPPVSATDALLERAEIDVGGGEKVIAIPLPGHTPGSYLYLFRGVLFTGDSMQRWGKHLEFAMASFSVSPADNRKNIAALGKLDVQMVCTGHQGCTPDGEGSAMLADLIKRASP